jgi:NAD(P)-dependent dehydrogenase (short-subunit alcohol dehydrogenase family)
MSNRSILITGCSLGISLASVRMLKMRGWRMFATARKPQDIARLSDEVSLEALYVDYSEPADRAAAGHVLAATRTGSWRCSIMAPMGHRGVVEDVRTEVLRAQFEAHVSDRLPLRGTCDRGLSGQYRHRALVRHLLRPYRPMEAGGSGPSSGHRKPWPPSLTRALEGKRPRSRYYVTWPTYMVEFLRLLLPTRPLDAVAARN